MRYVRYAGSRMPCMAASAARYQCGASCSAAAGPAHASASIKTHIAKRRDAMAERVRFELTDIPPRVATRGDPEGSKPASALRACADERSVSSERRDAMAERVRFELTERSSRSPAFEAGAFNHSTTSPRRRGDRPYYGVAGSMPASAPRARFARKKRCNCSVASSCIRPAVTSTRWFVLDERRISNAPPSAPPFGSGAA